MCKKPIPGKGVGYEKMIVTSDLLEEIDSNKVIPIIRQHASRDLPTFLKSKLYIDFSLADQYEFSFDELVRTIHNSPLYKKPDIGNNPFQPISEVVPEKAGDPIVDLLRIVVSDFEEGENWTNYTTLVGRFGASRILLDIVISDAVKKGLVTLDSDGDLYLSDKGKHFAIEHRLARGSA